MVSLRNQRSPRTIQRTEPVRYLASPEATLKLWTTMATGTEPQRQSGRVFFQAQTSTTEISIWRSRYGDTCSSRRGRGQTWGLLVIRQKTSQTHPIDLTIVTPPLLDWPPPPSPPPSLVPPLQTGEAVREPSPCLVGHFSVVYLNRVTFRGSIQRYSCIRRQPATARDGL